MASFDLIAAMDSERGIGKDGSLPWHLPGDLKHFKTLTTQTNTPEKRNAVIMGRKTWESIPQKFRPLPGRINVVLSRNPALSVPLGVLTFTDLEDALNQLKQPQSDRTPGRIFVIGGQQIFETALRSRDCQRLYITHIRQPFQCDTFFPKFEETYLCEKKTTPIEENNIVYFFADYRRRQT